MIGNRKIFVDPFARKGYRFKATRKVVVDGELFQQIMSFYRGRWVDTGKNKESSIRGFVLIKIESALPLISPSYDDGSSDEPAAWICVVKGL
jgi:hypothetical protein